MRLSHRLVHHRKIPLADQQTCAYHQESKTDPRERASTRRRPFKTRNSWVLGHNDSSSPGSGKDGANFNNWYDCDTMTIRNHMFWDAAGLVANDLCEDVISMPDHTLHSGPCRWCCHAACSLFDVPVCLLTRDRRLITRVMSVTTWRRSDARLTALDLYQNEKSSTLGTATSRFSGFKYPLERDSVNMT
jgi:hypothetical protein